MAANCHTFQPEQAVSTRRTGLVIDFSAEDRGPGETFSRQLGLAPALTANMPTNENYKGEERWK